MVKYILSKQILYCTKRLCIILLNHIYIEYTAVLKFHTKNKNKQHEHNTCIELGREYSIMENSGEFNWNNARITADASLRTSALFGSDIHVTIRETASRIGAEFTKSLASINSIKPRVYCSKDSFIFRVGVCVLSVMYFVMI